VTHVDASAAKEPVATVKTRAREAHAAQSLYPSEAPDAVFSTRADPLGHTHAPVDALNVDAPLHCRHAVPSADAEKPLAHALHDGAPQPTDDVRSHDAATAIEAAPHVHPRALEYTSSVAFDASADVYRDAHDAHWSDAGSKYEPPSHAFTENEDSAATGDAINDARHSAARNAINTNTIRMG
jgi:hypothetical protein